MFHFCTSSEDCNTDSGIILLFIEKRTMSAQYSCVSVSDIKSSLFDLLTIAIAPIWLPQNHWNESNKLLPESLHLRLMYLIYM